MNARLIRLACLGCGVLLALPPAWCCYAWQRPAEPAARPAPPSCCHHKRAKQDAPRPAPCRPPQPGNCPWCDHHTVAPTKSEQPDASPALPAPLALAVIDDPRAGPCTPAAAAPPVPSRSLHLLQCVWLC